MVTNLPIELWNDAHKKKIEELKPFAQDVIKAFVSGKKNMKFDTHPFELFPKRTYLSAIRQLDCRLAESYIFKMTPHYLDVYFQVDKTCQGNHDKSVTDKLEQDEEKVLKFMESNLDALQKSPSGIMCAPEISTPIEKVAEDAATRIMAMNPRLQVIVVVIVVEATIMLCAHEAFRLQFDYQFE